MPADKLCARTHGDARRSSIACTPTITGLHRGFIARADAPTTHALPYPLRSTRSASPRRAPTRTTWAEIPGGGGRSNGLNGHPPARSNEPRSQPPDRHTITSKPRLRTQTLAAVRAHNTHPRAPRSGTHTRPLTHNARTHTHPSHAHTCAGFIPNTNKWNANPRGPYQGVNTSGLP